MALLRAGRGRLPVGALPRGLMVLILLALGGLPFGLGLEARSLLLRAASDAGALRLALALPGLASLPLLAAGAFLLGRFAGGAAPERVDVARLMVLAVPVVAASAAAPALIGGVLAPVVAGVSGVAAEEVRASAALGLPPSGIMLGLALALLVLGVAAAATTRVGERPWRGAEYSLPPRMALAPVMAAALAAARLARGLDAAAAALPARRRPLAVLAWAGATAVAAVVMLR